MIISHKHKFIFLKTRKTAGSSTQAALSTICGDEDIITGDIIKDGVLDESNTAGQNMDKFYTVHPHPEIAGVKQYMGGEWDNYFKFAFVRNPFEIVVSRYHWDIGGKGKQETSIEGFREWIYGYCKPGGTYDRDLQHKYICINSKKEVDFVGKYESLNEDYETICQTIGAGIPELGFCKSGYRKKVHYSSYYTSEIVRLVSQYFEEDLQLFGYTFEYPRSLTVSKKLGVVISKDMLKTEADNINGPSVITVPDWVENPLGKYYIYFAHHQGTYIKLAYSDDLLHWTVSNKKPLTLTQTGCDHHIASPHVVVDDEIEQIHMFFHGDYDHKQYTARAVSDDGLVFNSEKVPLGLNDKSMPFYFKSCEFGVDRLGISTIKNGEALLCRGFENDFVGANEIGTLLPSVRHCDLFVKDETLYIFYSKIGDSPEHIRVCEMDVETFETKADYELLRPTQDYEGSKANLQPSKRGRTFQMENQVRDPEIFQREDGRLYMFYCGGGEENICLAQLDFL